MRQMTIEEVKMEQLNILLDIQRFCEENALTWWLDYGSLIGALRHNGYIPWDDDIDIGMFRGDFDIFKQQYNKQANSRYKLEFTDDDLSYPYVFAKVYDMETTLYEPDINGYKCHVYVDIFIYDNVPDDEREFKRMRRKLGVLRRLHTHQTNVFKPTGNILKRVAAAVARPILKLFPKGYFYKRYDSKVRSYDNVDTKRIMNFHSPGVPVQRTDMLNTKPAPFEEYSFPVPCSPDEHLFGRYGFPYTELPPEEDRVRRHSFVAFYNN
ncbi:MAG: LicD family protein [Clostridia bacterium]|nr:LicD family protein [Clostridia bacterium]